MRKFLKAQKGTVAVTFALSILPIFAAAGAAIDFGRYLSINTQLHAALDAASLAAASASGKTNAQREKIGKDTFASNIEGGAATGEVTTLTLKSDGKTITGEAHTSMSTSLMVALGLDSVDIGVTNEVAIPKPRKAEVAFVLDYSGSMADPAGGQTKYIAMRDAATKLIDTLTKDDPTKVKFALVPFSHHVYTSMPNSYVSGKGNSGTWTGCTQDRLYPLNLADSTPNTFDDATKWGQPNVPDHAAWGCNGYVNHHLAIQPLTNNFSALKSQLAAMTPYAYTHVPLGVEFGYHVLSPNAPYGEGVSYSDTTTSKFMVVLTDGAQTEPAWGPSGVRSVAQGDTNLEQICDNVKTSGITVITLAYDLDDSSQRQRLQNCATDPNTGFFVVNSGADLANAFSAITSAISAQVYLSK
jgi:Flp pilus assembly protein TadG